MGATYAWPHSRRITPEERVGEGRVGGEEGGQDLVEERVLVGGVAEGRGDGGEEEEMRGGDDELAPPPPRLACQGIPVSPRCLVYLSRDVGEDLTADGVAVGLELGGLVGLFRERERVFFCFSFFFSRERGSRGQSNTHRKRFFSAPLLTSLSLRSISSTSRSWIMRRVRTKSVAADSCSAAAAAAAAAEAEAAASELLMAIDRVGSGESEGSRCKGSAVVISPSAALGGRFAAASALRSFPRAERSAAGSETAAQCRTRTLR